MEEVTSYDALAIAIKQHAPPQTSHKRKQPSDSVGSAAAEFCVSNPPALAPKPENLDENSADDTEDPTEKQQSPSERLQRSRERNRVHARKTRQRKKEQMQTLQSRADELKQEQVRLKQNINEKNTANILVGLFATAGEKDVSQKVEDPRIEVLLRRPAEEIPDTSKITELPALILPGQHNSKKAKKVDAVAKPELPDDGIDYTLLGKDRSKCTPEELDKIRRERNRMHAKRTRDRKRLFMEEMSDMCKKLEDENLLLRNHLRRLDGEGPEEAKEEEDDSQSEAAEGSDTAENIADITTNTTISGEHVILDQLKTLIEVAGSFENKSTQHNLKGMMSLSSVASSVATAVSASDSNNSSNNASDTEDHHHGVTFGNGPSPKRRRIGGGADAGVSMNVPQSIAI